MIPSDARDPLSPRGLLLQRGLMVIKIGSSLLVDDDGRARRAWMQSLAAELASIDRPIVIVSSGAIALGRGALGLTGRPRQLAEAQAAAAIGQIGLAHAWADTWAEQDRRAAQVLLTLGDLEQRPRYLNARATLETLLERRIVPIVNENDTVATEEIRFGDNDRLAARVAQLLGAELLLLLSDVDGLYTADPAASPDARRIDRVDRIDADIEAMAGVVNRQGLGTGGMASKLAAAQIATDAGITVLLSSGRHANPIRRLLEDGPATMFPARTRPLAARKQWLRGLQHPAGRLHLDAGALSALEQGSSLLAVGVTAVEGDFKRGDLVAITGPNGLGGQGLSAYAADEARRIVGLRSEQIAEVLADAGRGPMIHRDDLVLFDRERISVT
ncbi:MAG: glutamate 5-kinase [Wenzhouxiangella sp.]|jgi:glutamate 5-kinase|nr:glutamate 5-kinase [Wenzhouxiangella sp.]